MHVHAVFSSMHVRPPYLAELLVAYVCDGVDLLLISLGLVYFFHIFIPEGCEDIREFGVHPILLNLLNYSLLGC
jgi:hypothetical protein